MHLIGCSIFGFLEQHLSVKKFQDDVDDVFFYDCWILNGYTNNFLTFADFSFLLFLWFNHKDDVSRSFGVQKHFLK